MDGEDLAIIKSGPEDHMKARPCSFCPAWLITTQELHTDKGEGRGRAGGGRAERREWGVFCMHEQYINNRLDRMSKSKPRMPFSRSCWSWQHSRTHEPTATNAGERTDRRLRESNHFRDRTRGRPLRGDDI